MSTVTQLLAEALTALLLIGDHFVSLHLVEDLGLYLHANIAEFQVAIVVGHDHVGELELIARVSAYFGDKKGLVFFDLELLAGYFYNCEHNGSKIRWAKVRLKCIAANKMYGHKVQIRKALTSIQYIRARFACQ